MFDKIYITSSKSSKKSFARKKRDSPATEKIDFYALLASKIRPYYNDIVVQNNSLGYESPKDSLWWWAKNDKLNLVYSNFVVDSYSEDSVIVVESHIPSFHLPVFFRNEVMHSSEVFYWYNPINFISWAFFVSLVLCLYALIKFATKHIFASNIINSNSHDIEDKLFRVDEERKNVFLIGLPKCGKTQFLHEKFPQEHNKLVINLIEVFYEDSWDDLFKKASNSDIDIIIIDHFEFNLENKDLTQKKLELLEKFLLLPKKKIIVSTSVHLSIIKELYSMKRNKERDDEAIYRWVELFKNFYEVYFPLQGFGPYNKKVRKFSKQSQAINNLLETEFNHGHYLEELRPEIEKLIERNEQNDITSDHDHIIMKIQSLCSVYYHLLWSTCTENEKYIIYDLAEDGLVNTKNFETIELLLNKGLIVFKDSLQVMNASFRNFVLTKIGPFEAIQMERKANKSGTWTMFRNPMIIILLAIAGFLVFTQQDTIHTALSFLTPLLALLPALIKIFGMIGSKKASSGADDN